MANSSTKSTQNGSKNQTPNPPFFPPDYNPNPPAKGEKSERFWFATAMIPLRLFLGISFIAAGLDKLTDPQFFNSSAPGYIGQQLTGFAQSSPIGWFLTSVAVPNATLFGWTVLLGELAIGLGTLVGLFSRTAAFFGVVLSLTLWLSSSFDVVPFFLGPDLPYAIGWITLMLAGAHPVWSLDSYIKAPASTPAKPSVASLKGGKSAQPVVVATPDHATTAQMARRRFVLIAGATLVTGMATGVAWAKTWKEESTKANTFNNLQAGNISSSSDTAAPSDTASATPASTATATTTTQTEQAATTSAAVTTQAADVTDSSAATTTTAAATTATPKPTAAPAVKGTKLVALASLPVGAGFKFTTPDTHTPAMVFHEQDGSVKAFSLICTHQGCEVEYYQQYKALACPCHGAVYDITNGQPTQGPARRALTAYKVQVDGSGNVVYVQQ